MIVRRRIVIGEIAPAAAGRFVGADQDVHGLLDIGHMTRGATSCARSALFDSSHTRSLLGKCPTAAAHECCIGCCCAWRHWCCEHSCAPAHHTSQPRTGSRAESPDEQAHVLAGGGCNNSANAARNHTRDDNAYADLC